MWQVYVIKIINIHKGNFFLTNELLLIFIMYYKGEKIIRSAYRRQQKFFYCFVIPLQPNLHEWYKEHHK